MKLRLVWIVLVPGLLMGCGPSEESRAPGELDVARLVPLASPIPEWTIAEELTEYTPETLFEYINGAAPQYVSYGFKKLAHIRYAYRGEDLLSVTVDVYDMGGPLGAYGIYSTGRPREIAVRPWGAEGYRSGPVAVAWKQQVYVHAIADEETPELIAMLDTMMERVLAITPGGDSTLEILSVLPEQDLIPHSDRYIGKDLLGHSFLPGGFLASYRLGGRESLLFFTDLGSPEAAEKTVGLFRAYEEEHGKVAGSEEEIGEGGFWADDPGLGLGMVTRADRYVVGIWGVASEADGRRILDRLVKNLERHQAG